MHLFQRQSRKCIVAFRSIDGDPGNTLSLFVNDFVEIDNNSAFFNFGMNLKLDLWLRALFKYLMKVNIEVRFAHNWNDGKMV